jgi:hypothetical protein
VDLIPDYVVTLAAATANEQSGGGGDNKPHKLSKSGTGNTMHSLSLSNIDEFMWTESIGSPLHDGMASSTIRERTVKEMDDSRLIVRVVSSHSAKVHLDSARPMLAAAQFLAVEDVAGAISILSNNFEHDMAYALAQCFHQDTTPHIIEMADQCASFKSVDLAVDMLSTLSNSEEEVGLLLSRYCSETEAAGALSKRKYRSLSAWLDRGNEEEQIGSDAECVTSYVIAQQYLRAVKVGMEVLKRIIREPLDLSQSNKKLLRSLKYVKAAALEEPLRIQFLMYIMWFTAHEAAQLGLWETACEMLSCLLTHNSLSMFVLAKEDIKYQLMFFHILSGSKQTIALVDAAHTQLQQQQQQAGGGGNPQDSAGVLMDLSYLLELLRSAPVPSKENMVLVSSAFKYKSSPIRMAEGVWGDHTHAIMKYVLFYVVSFIDHVFVL